MKQFARLPLPRRIGFILHETGGMQLETTDVIIAREKERSPNYLLNWKEDSQQQVSLRIDE